MDEAPYYAEASRRSPARCFRVVSRQDGQAGRAGFCSRSPAEPAPSASTAQASGVEIPGLTPSASDRLDMRPGARWRNQPFHLPLPRFHRSLRDVALSACLREDRPVGCEDAGS
jgi:hypothetical protein